MRRALPIILGLVLAGLPCFHRITETDAGWHLATGRLIAESGVPYRNALTWTAPDQPYYATSWLYDWLAASATRSLGIIGLQGLTLLFVALTLIGLALACEAVDPKRAPWMVPVAAIAIRERITERPHVASWALLTWVLWLCLSARQSPRTGWHRRLAGVALIAVGSNLHSGAAFPALVLAFFCVEAWLREGRQAREIGIAIAGVLALMANPGGVLNLRYLVENLHVRSVVNIIEMKPADPTTSPLFYIALLLGLAAAWHGRRRSPALLASTVLFAVLGLRAVRFSNDFELVAAVAVTQLLATFKARWVSMAPALATAALFCATFSFYFGLRYGSQFDSKQFPVRAASFVASQGLSGPMFNAFRDGGYLEWMFPQQRWFQDGRVQAFPEELFQREQQVESSPTEWREWLHELGAEWAIVSRWPEHMTGNTLFESPDWALVYWDETSEIRLRRDVSRFTDVIARNEYRHFRPTAPVNVGTAEPDELAEWDSELHRYEQTAPNFAEAFVIHCAVRLRLGSDPDSVCSRADALANTVQLRTTLDTVRRLRAE